MIGVHALCLSFGSLRAPYASAWADRPRGACLLRLHRASVETVRDPPLRLPTAGSIPTVGLRAKPLLAVSLRCRPSTRILACPFRWAGITLDRSYSKRFLFAVQDWYVTYDIVKRQFLRGVVLAGEPRFRGRKLGPCLSVRARISVQGNRDSDAVDQ